MLFIETTPLPNGAYRNQRCELYEVPEGWIAVPEELEEKTLSMLPFIVPVMKDGALIDVSQGQIPPAVEEQEGQA